MELTLDIRQAYSEVDGFIEILSDEEKNKIPRKLRDIFKNEKDQDYKFNIESLIKEESIKEDALAIIALLNLNYLCDENEKKELESIYDENERIYQKELRERYNPDNLFKDRQQYESTSSKTMEDNVETVQDTNMVEIKQETFIQKIINKIKSLFKKG